eukprot:4624178-Pleurochrysis_carterae.AAC.2
MDTLSVTGSCMRLKRGELTLLSLPNHRRARLGRRRHVQYDDIRTNSLCPKDGLLPVWLWPTFLICFSLASQVYQPRRRRKAAFAEQKAAETISNGEATLVGVCIVARFSPLNRDCPFAHCEEREETHSCPSLSRKMPAV